MECRLMDLQWICFPGSSFTGVEELRELPEAFDGIKGQTVGKKSLV
jgi:hypothetical protein